MSQYTDNFVNAVIAAISALQSSILDPATQIDTLISFCAFTSNTQQTAVLSQIEQATASLCRRAALSAIATACANYQPTSTTAAQAVIDAVRTVFNTEILYAGDNFEDDAFASLTSLSQSVIADLKARSTNLPNLTQYNLNVSLPVCVIANGLYGDATRADEVLNFNASVPHPWFFPASFLALSK